LNAQTHAQTFQPPLRIVASLPVRSLRDGKRRLAERLTAGQRRALIVRLLSNVVVALRESAVIAKIALVSGDDEILGFGAELDLEAVRESEPGLNAALGTASLWARDHAAQAHLMVLPDLPLLQAPDVQAVAVTAEGDAGITICPDRWHEGTNMLLLRPYNAIPPAFGPNSFVRHLDLASTSGLAVRVVDRPGTRWDLDTPQDLDDLGWEI